MSLAPWKILKVERPRKCSYIIFHCSSKALLQSLPNLYSIHFSPWSSLCAGTRFSSMFYLYSPPLFFLSLSSIPSLFFPFPYTSQKNKTIYNTAKPIWEQQASHSVGEGWWNAFCHQTSKLQHVKPRPIACPVFGSLISNVCKPNHLGNPFVIMTTLALA